MIDAAMARRLRDPLFTAAAFAPPRSRTADEKAWFANTLLRFLATDCPWTLFSERLYHRLSGSFGHIAHTNRLGFHETFFLDARGKVEFLEQSLAHPCYGSPGHTFCDVERRLQTRIREAGLLAHWREERRAEAEHAERALLAALRTKYENAPPPQPSPAAMPSPARPSRTPHRDERQPVLF